MAKAKAKKTVRKSTPKAKKVEPVQLPKGKEITYLPHEPRPKSPA